MEKIKDMQNNLVADDELEQISGGGKLWDAFTAEFNELFDKPKARKLIREEGYKHGRWGVGTLEMRVNDKERQDRKDIPDVIKL